MAITISGENNNDKILASDGVIDQISGFSIVGVVTATSFTGDLTGNVTGNLTGNVNSTSPLLLQTGGSERFRITGNNELGIAGANYGSSGQVLTSGGSGSAVSWTTIPTQITFSNPSNNRILTSEGGIGVNCESNLSFDGATLRINHTALTVNGDADDLVIGNLGQSSGITIASGTNYFGTIFFADTSTSGAGNRMGAIRYNHNSDHLEFNTGGNNQRVVITSVGDVGISSATPRAKLDVRDAGTSQNVILRVSADNNTPYALVVGNDAFNTTGNRGLAMWIGSNKVHHIEARTSTTANENELKISATDAIYFGTGSSQLERLRIQPDGTIVTGAQTVPTSSDIGNIYIKNASAIGSVSHQLNYVTNAVFNGSWKYITSSVGATQLVVNQNGYYFQTAASGTAGNNITFTQKFKVESDGTSQFDGSQVKLYNSTDNSNTYFYAQNTGAGNAGIKMKNSSGEWTIIANDRLRFIDDDAGEERLTITSAGRIGVNQTNPNARLYLKSGDGGNTAIVLDQTQDAANYHNSIDFKNNGTQYASISQGKDSGNTAFGLKFTTGSSYTERFRITHDGYLNFYNDSNTNKGLRWYNNVGGSAKAASIEWGNGNANWEFKHFRNDNQADNPYANIDFYTGGWTTSPAPTRALRITNDGNHIREKHSRFATRIQYDTPAEAVDEVLDFSTPHVNVGNDFDASNNYYVAPVDGDYCFFFHTNVAGGSGAYYVNFDVNGSEISSSSGGRIYDQHTGSGWHNLCGHIMLSLQEGDQVRIRNRVAMNFDGGSYGQFMGWLVG